MNTDNKKLFAGIAMAELIDADDQSELMCNYDIDRDTAERAQNWIDEGLDEDEAVELAEAGEEV